MPQIRRVVLYGSRAKGNYRSGSDIDLVIVGNDVSFRQLLKIENELDDLLLPYRIDLSLMHQINDPDLMDHIHRIDIVIYDKGDGGDFAGRDRFVLQGSPCR